MTGKGVLSDRRDAERENLNAWAPDLRFPTSTLDILK